MRNPCDTADVTRCFQLSADYPAQIIDQDIVVFGTTLRIRHDAFKNLEHGKRLNVKTRFFQNLSANGDMEPFAHLEKAARQRPEPFKRFLGALHQKDVAIGENQCTNPDQGPFRITAGVFEADRSANRERSL